MENLHEAWFMDKAMIEGIEGKYTRGKCALEDNICDGTMQETMPESQRNSGEHEHNTKTCN